MRKDVDNKTVVYKCCILDAENQVQDVAKHISPCNCPILSDQTST